MKLILSLFILNSYLIYPLYEPKIVFLPADVAEGLDEMGCTGNPMGIIAEYLIEKYPQQYIEFPLGKLIRNNIAVYYIFNKKYLHKIHKVLNADIYVMTRIVVINTDPPFPCGKNGKYSIHIKAYNYKQDKELTIYKNDNVKSDDLTYLFEGKEKEITEKLLKAY